MSDRFNGGSTDMGQSTWLYDGTSTINIGMTDPAHTRNDGYRYSRSYHLNESGQVTGQSQLFNGGTSMGYSAWLYNGATTIDLTLTSPEYIRRSYCQLLCSEIFQAASCRIPSMNFFPSKRCVICSWPLSRRQLFCAA